MKVDLEGSIPSRGRRTPPRDSPRRGCPADVRFSHHVVQGVLPCRGRDGRVTARKIGTWKNFWGGGTREWGLRFFFDTRNFFETLKISALQHGYRCDAASSDFVFSYYFSDNNGLLRRKKIFFFLPIPFFRLFNLFCFLK